MLETWVQSLGHENPLEKVMATYSSGGSDSEESTCNAGELASIPELAKSPGGGHSNPLQCSFRENPHGQRSLAGYSPWGCKESNTTE